MECSYHEKNPLKSYDILSFMNFLKSQDFNVVVLAESCWLPYSGRTLKSDNISKMGRKSPMLFFVPNASNKFSSKGFQSINGDFNATPETLDKT